MKVGFTGTQSGMSDFQKLQCKDLLRYFSPSQFHHGDCIGADDESHTIAESLGLFIVIHPPENPIKRAFAGQKEKLCSAIVLQTKQYIERNHDIVDATDIMFVAPLTDKEQQRSGTWATYRYAKKQGKEIYILQR